MHFQFSNGPKIKVFLHFEAFDLKKTSLFFSDHFECVMEGEAKEQQKNDLLIFLENYGKKHPSFIDLNLEALTSFRKKTLGFLQKVSFGETVTYGELAVKIKHPKAARAVGMACHHNPYPLLIPCHRVIASGKNLGGFAYDLKMKKLLLEFENNSH